MKLSELITLAENRLASINQAIVTASRTGNASELASLEAEAEETQTTLDELRGLQASDGD